MKQWLLCATLTLFNNIALARPAMSDVYDSSTDSSSLFIYIGLFAVAWILKSIFKVGDTASWGAFILMAIAAGLIIFGVGSTLIGLWKKYPLLAVLIVVFYWWVLKKK